jgi:hypothetical protein
MDKVSLVGKWQMGKDLLSDFAGREGLRINPTGQRFHELHQ